MATPTVRGDEPENEERFFMVVELSFT